METRISTEQLLQIIGEKQVALEVAQTQAAAYERLLREHMATDHPAPEPAEPETTSDVDA